MRNYFKGDVFFADCGTITEEDCVQKGWRPVVVVSNNIGNLSDIVIVAPVTRKERDYMPTHMHIEILHKNGRELATPVIGTILCEQLRVLDKRQIKSLKGHLDSNSMQLLDNKLAVALGIPFGEGVRYCGLPNS